MSTENIVLWVIGGVVAFLMVGGYAMEQNTKELEEGLEKKER